MMVSDGIACLRAQKWANLWGKVGLVGLSARNPDDIRQYRNVLEQLDDPHWRFTIFPRDAIDKRGSVSVVMRETFRAFNPLCLPEVLFHQNRGLKGSLKVTHVKTYTDAETTRAGASKKGWRLVLMQGCSTFMRSLEEYDEDHKFAVSSCHLYIRGGVRRPKTASSRERGPRGRSGTRGGLSDTRTDRRRRSSDDGGAQRDHDQTYDRNYPRLGGRTAGPRGRGSRRDSEAAPGTGGRGGPGARSDNGSRRE